MASGRSRTPRATRQDGPQALRQIGEQLRDARLARGDDLQEIATYLRIKPPFLAALEAGDLAAIPGWTYAMGFLRSYAQHLELDGDLLVARLRPMARDAATERVMSAAKQHGGPQLAQGAVMVLSLLVAGALWFGILATAPERDSSPAMVAQAPVPPTLSPGIVRELAEPTAPGQGSAGTASAVAAEASPLATLVSLDSEGPSLPATHPADSRVTLVGHSGTWVQLRSGDRAFVRSGTLAAGERLAVPLRPLLHLSTGNAGAIEILVDGQSVGFVGSAGAIVRDLTLAPEILSTSSRPAR